MRIPAKLIALLITSGLVIPQLTNASAQEINEDQFIACVNLSLQLDDDEESLDRRERSLKRERNNIESMDNRNRLNAIRIESMRAYLDRSNPYAVAAFNEEVRKQNENVAYLRQKAREFDRKVDSYNDRLDRFDEDLSRYNRQCGAVTFRNEYPDRHCTGRAASTFFCENIKPVQ